MQGELAIKRVQSFVYNKYIRTTNITLNNNFQSEVSRTGFAATSKRIFCTGIVEKRKRKLHQKVMIDSDVYFPCFLLPGLCALQGD